MLTQLKTGKTKRMLVNLERVAWIEDLGKERAINMVPAASGDGSSVVSFQVKDALDELAAMAPWMLRTSVDRPFGDRLDALVAVGHFVLAQPLKKKTVLHLTLGDRGTHVIVRSTPADVLAHGDGAGALKRR